jgi:hypothetical protein
MRPVLSSWWHDKRTAPPVSHFRSAEGAGTPAPGALRHGRTMRAAAALAIAALAADCFQPLYGEQSPTGGPVLRDQLSAVDVLQIQAPKGSDEARIAVEIRNALPYVARVSYDIPGQEQRFARVRGLRGAELRAAKVIADNMRSRLAYYFIAGT